MYYSYLAFFAIVVLSMSFITYAQLPLPKGSYRKACSDCLLSNPHVLECSCKNEGSLLRTDIDPTTCQGTGADIVSDGGHLACKVAHEDDEEVLSGFMKFGIVSLATIVGCVAASCYRRDFRRCGPGVLCIVPLTIAVVVIGNLCFAHTGVSGSS